MRKRFVFVLLAVGASVAVAGGGLARHRYDHDAGRAVVRATFDTCLHGRWREVSLRVESEVAGDGPVTLTGAGRVLRFDRGTGIVEYGAGVTYAGRTARHQVRIERSGTVTYRVRAEGDQLTFTGVAADGAERVLLDGAELSRQPFGLASPPLRFDCQGGTLTFDRTRGYRAVLERTRP